MKTAVTENEKLLIEYLHDLVVRACYIRRDKVLDSMAESTYSEPMKLLAEYGVITIFREIGRRVIARDELQEWYKL